MVEGAGALSSLEAIGRTPGLDGIFVGRRPLVVARVPGGTGAPPGRRGGPRRARQDPGCRTGCPASTRLRPRRRRAGWRPEPGSSPCQLTARCSCARDQIGPRRPSGADARGRVEGSRGCRRSAIGVSRPRLDSEAKVAGTLRFAADEAVPGLLHGRLVLSTEAHATIERVDIAAALEVAGVVRVLIYEDLPLALRSRGRAHVPAARRPGSAIRRPTGRDRPGRDGGRPGGGRCRRVAVEYMPLEPVLDLEAAMAIGSPLARHGRQGGEAAGLGHAPAAQASEALPEEELSANVAARHHYRHGDAAWRSPPRMSSSAGASGRAGSTRPISSRRSPPPGSSPTASWSYGAARRRSSTRSRS